MPEIIRQGDPTSHGGTVIEGSLTDICHGKAIAYMGHKVSCPKCKGVFPIIEGVLTTTFYGKGVAVAGMKAACGAVLIATQFTDTVEWSGASGGGGRRERAETERAEAMAAAANGQLVNSPGTEPAGCAIRFQAIDPETARPAPNTPYILTRESGALQDGITDGDGYTLSIETAAPEKLAVHFVFMSPIGNKISREDLI